MNNNTIIACFDHHPAVVYTYRLIGDLKSDPDCCCICDGQTGEVLYERGGEDDDYL